MTDPTRDKYKRIIQVRTMPDDEFEEEYRAAHRRVAEMFQEASEDEQDDEIEEMD